ncbi:MULTISPECIES: hypothetical protein [Lactobacillus]|nr:MULTISPECIES: hypothetical protein [Lactobacillus]
MKNNSSKFDKRLFTWGLVAQVIVGILCLYLISIGYFTALPV